MQSQRVVVDACVLVETAVSNLLLRISEEHGLLDLKWSRQIWEEVSRTWTLKLGWPTDSAARRMQAATSFFPEAMVHDYESLVDQCTNHPKDRHVLAVAIKADAPSIVTFNEKDFPPRSCSQWGIDAISPDSLLVLLVTAQPDQIRTTIATMADDADRTSGEILGRLAWTCRTFARLASTDLEIPITEVKPADWRR